MERNIIAEAIDGLQVVVHKNAVDKGFWPKGRSDAECIALIHSEVSECLEALRSAHPNHADTHCILFEHAEIEAADAIIRILDLAEHKGWKLGEAICEKIKYNATRKYKHGKKF